LNKKVVVEASALAIFMAQSYYKPACVCGTKNAEALRGSARRCLRMSQAAWHGRRVLQA
jgi:hypothetical protein